LGFIRKIPYQLAGGHHPENPQPHPKAPMDPSTKEIAEIKRSPSVPYPMLLVVNLGTTGHDITNLNNAFVIREISKKNIP